MFATGKILDFFFLWFFNFSDMRRTGSDVNMAKDKVKFRAATSLLMFSTFSAIKLSRSRTWHMDILHSIHQLNSGSSITSTSFFYRVNSQESIIHFLYGISQSTIIIVTIIITNSYKHLPCARHRAPNCSPNLYRSTTKWLQLLI